MYSKTAHINIIYEIAKGLCAAGHNGKYLEIGVQHARTFNKVGPLFKHAHAVDVNEKMRKCVNFDADVNVCTSDDYFKNDKNKYDLIFIDGLHEYSQVQKDFDNAFNSLKRTGMIILHDTFPPGEKCQSEHYCWDAHRIREYLDDCLEIVNIEVLTLPFYYGLTIVRNV